MNQKTPTPTAPRLCLLAAVILLAVLGSVDLGLNALKAAGLVGTPPQGASVFQTLIATLTQNAVWLFVTGISLVLTVIALMVAFASRGAPDHLFRVVGAVGLILVVIPAVLG